MKILSISLFSLALLGVGFSVVGCGPSGGPNPVVEKARVNKAIEMRKLFDKAGGDYSKLDGVDKTKFDELAGGASVAEKTWNEMKTGPTGDASSRGPR